MFFDGMFGEGDRYGGKVGPFEIVFQFEELNGMRFLEF